MQKINFKNLPDTSTPINAENLNQIQTNIEKELEARNNYIEGRVWSTTNITPSTLTTIPYTTSNYIGNGMTLSNGVITINDENIKKIHIIAGVQNTTWISSSLNLYVNINGERRATNVSSGVEGYSHAIMPVSKGDQIKIDIYSEVAIKLENSSWTYLNVSAR